MRPPLFAILLVACGRIGFDPGVRNGDGGADDASGDGSIVADSPLDAPPPACRTNPAYVTSAGLTNRYREGIPLVTWNQARADCMADGADLWVVESVLEQNAFTGDWTGITDDLVENVWRKLDGTVATFLPFQGGQPDGGTGENCIRTDSAGFEDRDCMDLRDYVCECPF